MVLAKLVSNGWSNNYLNAAFTSALMFGYFLGSLAGGFIGDYLGRRKAFRVRFTDRRDLCLRGNLCTQHVLAYLFPLFDGHWNGGANYGGLCLILPNLFLPRCAKWSARLSFVGNWSPMLSAAIGIVVIAF